MKYRFRATRTFWRSFGKLPVQQQRRAREAFVVFKQNPFDPRLRPHKIHKLSAAYGKTVHAIVIEGDLRATFYVEGNTVWSVDIGTHEIYRQ